MGSDDTDSSVRRRRQELHYQRRCFAIVCTLAIVRVTTRGGHNNSQLAERRSELEWGPPALPVRKTSSSSGSSSSTSVRAISSHVHPASIDTIIKYLTKMAELPPSQLWEMLGMDDDDDDVNNYGDDPFSLRQLESGICPWKTTDMNVPWLPPRPYNSEKIAEMYRKNIQSAKKYQRKPPPPPTDDNDDEDGNAVAIWYEHLSKAGGTTFCAIANSNMVRWQVPIYHCMPAKGKLKDGRIGFWSNEEVAEHISKSRHAIISNEWEPFSLEKLEMSGRQLDGTPFKQNRPPGPRLLFVTTLRDPSDRLLSAYTFFGITVKTAKRDDDNFDAPSFNKWRTNWLNRVRNHEQKFHGGCQCHTARSNHIVWRFSGGSLDQPYPGEENNEWRSSFITAIQALSQFDLILPMDVMTDELVGQTVMHEFLGWEDIIVKSSRNVDETKTSLVTIGKRQNSNAREYFPKDEYRDLWEENWLDHILYLWCRAVFLARLHCSDVLEMSE